MEYLITVFNTTTEPHHLFLLEIDRTGKDIEFLNNKFDPFLIEVSLLTGLDPVRRLTFYKIKKVVDAYDLKFSHKNNCKMFDEINKYIEYQTILSAPDFCFENGDMIHFFADSEEDAMRKFDGYISFRETFEDNSYTLFRYQKTGTNLFFNLFSSSIFQDTSIDKELETDNLEGHIKFIKNINIYDGFRKKYNKNTLDASNLKALTEIQIFRQSEDAKKYIDMDAILDLVIDIERGWNNDEQLLSNSKLFKLFYIIIINLTCMITGKDNLRYLANIRSLMNQFLPDKTGFLIDETMFETNNIKNETPVALFPFNYLFLIRMPLHDKSYNDIFNNSFKLYDGILKIAGSFENFIKNESFSLDLTLMIDCIPDIDSSVQQVNIKDLINKTIIYHNILNDEHVMFYQKLEAIDKNLRLKRKEKIKDVFSKIYNN